MLRRAGATALLAVAALLAAYCGDHTPATTPLPTFTPTATPVSPQAVLSQAGQVMAGMTSFHFRMTHESGATEFLPGLKVDEVSGDVQTPDQLYAEFTGLFAGFAIKARLIAIGEANYMTNPLSGLWEKVDTQVTPIGFFNPREGVATMMGRVEDPAFVDQPTEASDSYLIAGLLAADALRPLLGNTLKDAPVNVELRIERASLRLLQATFDGRVTPTDQEGTLRVVTLSRFNEPVTIEPPQ